MRLGVELWETPIYRLAPFGIKAPNVLQVFERWRLPTKRVYPDKVAEDRDCRGRDTFIYSLTS